MVNRNVLISSLIALTGGTAFVITKPALAFQLRAAGASGLAIGLMASAYFSSRGLGSLIAIRAYRKFEVIPLLFILSSLISLLYETSDPIEATALRFLHGLVLGVIWTGIQMLVGISARYVATAYSVYFLFGSLSLPMGNFLYSIAPNLSFKVSAVLFLISASLAAMLSPIDREVRKRRGKAIIYLLTFILVFRVATSLPNTEIVYVYLNDAFKMGKALAASAIGVASLIGIPLSLLLSYVSDTIGDRPSLLIVVSLALLGLLMMTTPYVIAGLTALMVSAKVFVPISRRMAVEEAGKEGVGYLNFFNSVGMVISGILYGFALDNGLIAPTMDFLALLILILSLKVLKPERG